MENIAGQSLQILYLFVLRADKVTIPRQFQQKRFFRA